MKLNFSIPFSEIIPNQENQIALHANDAVVVGEKISLLQCVLSSKLIYHCGFYMFYQISNTKTKHVTCPVFWLTVLSMVYAGVNLNFRSQISGMTSTFT